MYDYIDDQGAAALNLLGLSVSQDTTERDVSPTRFAWPEEHKYAMATEKDVVTSSVYFGLYGSQLEEDVQEKIASNLNRAIDAFDIRRAIEKIAVLPDYSRLSQEDMKALSRDDTPSDRVLRRLKRMGIYGGVGGAGGAVLSKLVSSKVNPFWVAVPAALSGGIGLAKGASMELLDHIFGDADDLDSALENVDYDIQTHSPPQRRAYAKQLKTAAENADAEIPDVIEQYASDTFGPRVEPGLEMRSMISDEYEGFFDKHANVGPSEFADELYKLDMKLGLVVNSRIPDAYYTTFGKSASASESDPTYVVVDGRPFKLSDARRLHEYKHVLNRLFPSDITDELYNFPWKFNLISHPYQVIVARAVFEAMGKDKDEGDKDDDDDKSDKKKKKAPKKKSKK